MIAKRTIWLVNVHATFLQDICWLFLLRHCKPDKIAMLGGCGIGASVASNMIRGCYWLTYRRQLDFAFSQWPTAGGLPPSLVVSAATALLL